MSKILINYATYEFRISQKLNSLTGKYIAGFDRVINYSPKNIPKKFKKKHTKIFNAPRGGGYWVWKPYIILNTLKNTKEGDIIFYCDSGALFIKDLKPIFDICQNKQDIVCFSVGLREAHYSKRDAFILMDCDTNGFENTFQRLSGYICVKNTKYSKQFFHQFLKFNLDNRIVSDEENVLGVNNYEDFIENRHDQTIFSLLSKKYNIPCYRDPSRGSHVYYEDIEVSNYEQLIEGTRKRHYLPQKNLSYYLSQIKAKLRLIVK